MAPLDPKRVQNKPEKTESKPHKNIIIRTEFSDWMFDATVNSAFCDPITGPSKDKKEALEDFYAKIENHIYPTEEAKKILSKGSYYLNIIVGKYMNLSEEEQSKMRNAVLNYFKGISSKIDINVKITPAQEKDFAPTDINATLYKVVKKIK